MDTAYDTSKKSIPPTIRGNHAGLVSKDPTNKLIRLTGWSLLIAFLFPVITVVRGEIKFVFLNIEMFARLTDIPGMLVFQFCFPLLAGGLMILAYRWKRSYGKAFLLLGCGLAPILFFLAGAKGAGIFGKSFPKVPEDFSLSGGVMVLYITGLTLMLAGAYAVRVNPLKRLSRYAAAFGATLYLEALLLPFNGRFAILSPFKQLVSERNYENAVQFFMGILNLVFLILVLWMIVLCLRMIKPAPAEKYRQMGKITLRIFFGELAVFGAAMIIVIGHLGSQSPVPGETLFLVFSSILIKMATWIFGISMLVILGISEFLLLNPVPTAPFSVRPPGTPRYGAGVRKEKKSFLEMIQSPGARIAYLLVILGAILFVLFYRAPRDPRAGEYLLTAAKNGNPGRTARLLRSGADVNGSGKNKKNPLNIAVRQGHVKVVRILLDHGADPDAWGAYNRGPLHNACRKGSEEIVRLLIENGADVNIKTRSGKTPLRFAISTNKPGIAKILIENGADVVENSKRRGNLLHLALEYPGDEIPRLLIEQGVKIHARDESGFTPFVIALRSGNLPGVRLMLEKGCNVNRAQIMGMTPLHVAAQFGHLDVVNFLLEKGADVRARNIVGKTPLHVAVWRFVDEQTPLPPPGQDKSAVVKALIDKGAPLEVKCQKGNTPLHDAFLMGSLQEVKTLVENGANLDAANRNGEKVPYITTMKGAPISPYIRRGRKRIRDYLLSKISGKNKGGKDE